MSDQLVREIIASGSAMLRDFASAAKTTGEHVYAVLVRQQLVEGIGMIILAGLAAGIACFLFPFYKRLWIATAKKEGKTDYSDSGAYWMAYSVFTIISVVVIGLLLFWVSDGVKHILNPEFYALKFIFDQVHPR